MTIIDLANQAVSSMFDSLNDLAERYGAEITDYEELVRALRWQVEHYKAKPRELQERINELEEQVRDLEESNGNLRAMLRTAKTYRKRTLEEEAAWIDEKRAEYEADHICGHYWGNI